MCITFTVLLYFLSFVHISTFIFFFFFFFFNDTATTEIYTLSLHDALPICASARPVAARAAAAARAGDHRECGRGLRALDRRLRRHPVPLERRQHDHRADAALR